MEDVLTLDELLLTDEAVQTRTNHLMKFHAAIQGIELPDNEEPDEKSADELPPEFWEQDRAMKERRDQPVTNPEEQELSEFKLGYSVEGASS